MSGLQQRLARRWAGQRAPCVPTLSLPDRADIGYCFSPALCRYGNVREPKCGMIACRGSRHCKEQCEWGANEGGGCEGHLSEKARDGTGDRANNDRFDRPRTAVIGGKLQR